MFIAIAVQSLENGLFRTVSPILWRCFISADAGGRYRRRLLLNSFESRKHVEIEDLPKQG